MTLTGAERTQLRGRGQLLRDMLTIGTDGGTTAVLAELNRQLGVHELVKVRFTGGQDRHQRAALNDSLSSSTQSECVGSVGHTALFWRARAPKEEAAARS